MYISKPADIYLYNLYRGVVEKWWMVMGLCVVFMMVNHEMRIAKIAPEC